MILLHEKLKKRHFVIFLMCCRAECVKYAATQNVLNVLLRRMC